MKWLLFACLIFTLLTSCNNSSLEATTSNQEELSILEADSSKITSEPDVIPTQQDTIVYSEITDSLAHLIGEEYAVPQAKDYLLLCHQAGWSLGEYQETAPIFNAMGYSTLAISQISGGEINGVINYAAANFNQDTMAYTDALPNIENWIDIAYKKNNRNPIILVGSSYSAALALLIGNRNPKVKAVIAFSPGEYLKGYTLSDSIAGFSKPLFVTSSHKEHLTTIDLLAQIGTPTPFVHFDPQEGEGKHGSRALWKENKNHQEYWDALTNFLLQLENQKTD